jgi:putative transposase
LLCPAHPKLGPGQIACIYKDITARELFKALPKLRKRLWGGEFWTERYFVETVAQRGSWTALLRYVKNQGHKPEDTNLRLLFPEPEP